MSRTDHAEDGAKLQEVVKTVENMRFISLWQKLDQIAKLRSPRSWLEVFRQSPILHRTKSPCRMEEGYLEFEILGWRNVSTILLRKGTIHSSYSGAFSICSIQLKPIALGMRLVVISKRAGFHASLLKCWWAE